ncbi:hypothetical protein CIG75_00985 [Tumebacillus algifaecis]|uniref:Metallo-beta-lactamase domain-containing protein n=1 Tax=Tumebacillus algifaecis TaxID=1214604 RepID=A0A223CWJ3_9BACL|nr:MBL fold metallo-hydrolase [Tumebacillus algifaecis]ASS73688.1 hypothetical protein CIG75_00985 [Tumebacillus algifaecis]
MWVFLIIVVSVVLLLLLFLKFYPTMGGKASKAKLHRFSQSNNYQGGKFINHLPTGMDVSATTMLSILRDYSKGNRNVKPRHPLPMTAWETRSTAGEGTASVRWFGHSALLVELDGKTLLLDPMFGKIASPLPPFGTKRYKGELSINLEDFPEIDAVLLSHDHYDHLDYGSIRRLKDKVGTFIVPLGVGSHLERWGVAPEKIQEHDWWEEASFAGLKLVCTPARHLSGRGLTDNSATLWCSWVIIGEQAKLYFSGDSGYGPHFQQIGEQYGPFDLTLMECGQYDPRWSAIHMMPEETVQAHLDVRGNVLLPIHWAGFTLALHDWTDPIERVTNAAQAQGVVISTPKIGEAVSFPASEYPASHWWR